MLATYRHGPVDQHPGAFTAALYMSPEGVPGTGRGQAENRTCYSFQLAVPRLEVDYRLNSKSTERCFQAIRLACTQGIVLQKYAVLTNQNDSIFK